MRCWTGRISKDNETGTPMKVTSKTAKPFDEDAI